MARTSSFPSVKLFDLNILLFVRDYVPEKNRSLRDNDKAVFLSEVVRRLPMAASVEQELAHVHLKHLFDPQGFDALCNVGVSTFFPGPPSI